MSSRKTSADIRPLDELKRERLEAFLQEDGSDFDFASEAQMVSRPTNLKKGTISQTRAATYLRRHATQRVATRFNRKFFVSVYKRGYDKNTTTVRITR